MAEQQAAGGAKPKQHTFKVVLLGTVVTRFVRDQFDPYKESTIGAAFLMKVVPIDSENSANLHIWDTAGQERYKSLAPMYYRNAAAAVVVYDITQAASFERAKSWVKELQRQAEPSIIIALAGNKTDLADRRTVSREEGSAYAQDAGLLFFETSAKSGEQISELFAALAKKIPLSAEPAPSQGQGVNIGSSTSGASTGGDCAC
ncbi:ras-domain-containing protein [Martensiomyces pterosporus]|nr:ras-domain-containing protein [Martensiomyces pterosporus]